MYFNSPLSLAKADQLIGSFGISSGDRVLDVGCGKGEFLIRTVEQSGAIGLGIDMGESLITAAKQAAAGRVPEDSCEFRSTPIADAELEDESFSLAMCIGSTHAYGEGGAAFPNAIRELSRLVRPGGRILLGEGYWKQEPDPDYLAQIGDPVGIYRDHAGNVSFGEEQGLLPLYAIVSNEDEWDHFEWSHRMAIEQQVREAPDDVALVEKRNRSRAWRDAYLRWGRSTMGFGFYLFEKV